MGKKLKSYTTIAPLSVFFSWEREGNSYASTLLKNFKTSQSVLSDHKFLQRTCLDFQCVHDALQNWPLLQITCIFSANFTPFQ